MDVRNSPFQGILDSFAKPEPNVGILSEREHRIPGTIQKKEPNGSKTNFKEQKLFNCLKIWYFGLRNVTLNLEISNGKLIFKLGKGEGSCYIR